MTEDEGYALYPYSMEVEENSIYRVLITDMRSENFHKLCSGQSILNLCARRAQKFIGIILVRGQQKSPSCSIFFNHQI